MNDTPLNLAERLHQILKKARHCNPTEHVIDVWAKVFEVPREQSIKNELEIISFVKQTEKLIDEIENKIKQIEDVSINQERLLKPFPRIRKVFPQEIRDLFRAHNEFMGHINEGDLVILEFCSDALSKHFPEKQVDEKELEKILDATEKLYRRIITAKIQEPLKAILLDLLVSIRQAIHEYNVRGNNRLKEGVADILGRMLINNDLILHSKDPNIKKVRDICVRFISTWAFAADTVQLIDAANKVLPLLPAIAGLVK